jgi:MFS family permease
MKSNSKKALVIVMSLGMFVVVLDNTIMNVSISALVEDLGTTVSGIQAAISLNALMMAAFVLMGGKMADIIGMKKTFMIGTVFYIAGSTLASFSNNLAVFILGWCAIQGFGAAMMLPNVNTIIRAYTKGKERAEAYGMLTGVNALGMAMGPIVGGFLTTYFSWRWAFRLEVLTLIVVVISSGVIPKDVLQKIRPKLDVVGVFLQATAMVFAVVGVLLISDYGLFMAKQPFIINGYEIAPFGLSIVPLIWGIGILTLMAFVRWEKKIKREGKDVLMDLNLFKIKDYTKSVNVRFIHVALIAGTTFAVPLYLQVTYGLSAFQTGFILLALSLGLLLSSIFGSKKGLQYLPKSKINWGFLIGIVGLLGMMLYVIAGNSPKGLVPGLFVFGIGMGLVASQIINLILSSVKIDQTAEASGVESTFETLGSSVGTAIVGTILVISLTAGIANMVEKSEVFPEEVKTEITSNMQTSVEIVSNEVVSEQITEDGALEAEAVAIYNTARQNAFQITLLSMAFITLLAYIMSRDLPAKKLI